MNKKGITSTLVKVILISMSFLVIISFVIGIVKRFETNEIGEILKCRSTLQAGKWFVDDAAPAGANLITDNPRACNTITKNIRERDREKVMKEVSNMIANSWYMTLEGSQENIWGDDGFFNRKCFVTYLFDIEEWRKHNSPEGQVTENDVEIFMKENTYRTFEIGDELVDYKYWDYVTFYKGAGFVKIILESVNEELNGKLKPEVNYAVVVLSSGGFQNSFVESIRDFFLNNDGELRNADLINKNIIILTEETNVQNVCERVEA